MTATMYTRWMVARDLPQILAIEQSSFSPPWTEADFLAALRNRSVIGMVVEPQDAILGYCLYELHRHRLELLTLAVHPQYRRVGVASCMMRRLHEKCVSHHRSRVVARVRESNTPAHLFFRAAGFVATGFDRTPDDGEPRYVFALPAVAGVRREILSPLT